MVMGVRETERERGRGLKLPTRGASRGGGALRQEGDDVAPGKG